MTNITCILCGYRRPENVKLIVQRLREQSARPNIWLWDNDGTDLPPSPVDWHIRSSRNVLGSGIMYLMSQLETPYWCYMDDDYVPAATATTLLQELTEKLGDGSPRQLISAHGVRLRKDRTYRQCCNLNTEEPAKDILVDVAKFRIVAGHNDPVKSLPRCWPSQHTDLHISMALAAGQRYSHLVSSLFHGRMDNLPEGKVGFSRQRGHYEGRDRLVETWLNSMG